MEPTLAAQIADVHPDPSDIAVANVYFDHVRSSLAALSPPQRAVLQLAYLDGHTREEISRILNIPVGTVKSRLFDALRRLQSVMDRPLARPEADQI